MNRSASFFFAATFVIALFSCSAAPSSAQGFKLPKLPLQVKKYLPFPLKKKKHRGRRRTSASPDLRKVPLPVRKPRPAPQHKIAEQAAQPATKNTAAPQPEPLPVRRQGAPEIPERFTKNKNQPSAKTPGLPWQDPRKLSAYEQDIKLRLSKARAQLRHLQAQKLRAKKAARRKTGTDEGRETAANQVPNPKQDPRKGQSKNTPPEKTRETVVVLPDVWSKDEINRARTHCRSILSGLKAVTIRVPPIKKGRCGTPAPVQLRAIGAAHQVKLRPAATINCNMVKALDSFLRAAQGAAQKRLGAKIAQLSHASAYVCRHRYNDKSRKISQHAFANALDIAGFTLTDGRKVSLLKDWGPTRKELARKELARKEQEAKKKRAEELKKNAQKDPNLQKIDHRSDAKQQHKKAPTASRASAKKETAAQQRSAFLKHLHKLACKTFGTVLGPEANAAHRDHFHFDLAPRRRSNYCQ